MTPRYCLPLITLGLATLAPLPEALAADLTPGLSGNVALYTGVSRFESNLNTEGANTLAGLDGPTERESEALVVPIWDLSYGFANRHQLVSKVHKDGILNKPYLTLGYRYHLTGGTVIGGGIIPGLIPDETWADPYRPGARRSTSDVDSSGAYLTLDNLFSPGLKALVAYGQQDIDQERSGQDQSLAIQQQLERDADVLYGQLSQELSLSDTLQLTWTLHARDHQADGDAEAYQGGGGALELQGVFGRHILGLEAGWARYRYDGSHPLFDRKRRDDVASASLTYGYAAPFNLPDTLAIAQLGWDDNDANLDFFDEQAVGAAVGLRWSF